MKFMENKHQAGKGVRHKRLKVPYLAVFSDFLPRHNLRTLMHFATRLLFRQHGNPVPIFEVDI